MGTHCTGPPDNQTCTYEAHAVGKRAVRILLQCFLVIVINSNSWKIRLTLPDFFCQSYQNPSFVYDFLSFDRHRLLLVRKKNSDINLIALKLISFITVVMYISTKIEGSFPSQIDRGKLWEKVDKSESKFGCLGPVSFLSKLNDVRWFKHTFHLCN